MTLPFPDVAATLLLTIGLAVCSLMQNPRRPQNQAFALMAALSSLWLFAIYMAFSSKEPGRAWFWIASCNAAGPLVVIGVQFTRKAILGQSLKEAIRSSKAWIFVALGVSLFCFTPWYFKGARIMEVGIPEPILGPGLLLFTIYLTGGFFLIAKQLHKDRRTASGVMRLELDYLYISTIIVLTIGTFLSTLLPTLTGSFQSARFAYLWLVGLNLVTAYGISTERMWSAGVTIQRFYAQLLMIAVYTSIYLICHAGFALAFPESRHALVIGVASAVIAAYGGSATGKKILRFLQKLRLTGDSGALQKTLSEMNFTVNKDNLVGESAKRVRDAVGASHAGIYLKLKGGYQEQEQLGWISDEDPLPAGFLRHALSADRLTKQRSSSEILTRMKQLAIRVAVPLWHQDSILGFLAIGGKMNGEPFYDDELRQLEAVGGAISTALTNIQLYEEMAEQANYQRLLVDNISEGLVAQNRAGELTTCNRKARELLSLSNDELPKEIEQILLDAFLGKYSEGTEYRLNSKILSIYSHDFNAGNEAYVLMHDVSNQRALELKFQAEVENRDRLIRLVKDVAHDMKNPLSTVKTFAELLPSKLDNERFRTDFVKQMLEDIRRIDTAVYDLLTTEMAPKKERRSFKIATTLENALALAKPLASNHAVSIRLNSNIDPNFTLLGDEQEIQGAIGNLLVNAIESAGSGGKTVEINASVSSSAVKIEIKDSGVGIAADILPLIFQAEFTTKKHGTGIGLWSVAQTAANHQGRVSATSDGPNQGATFSLQLPLPSQPALAIPSIPS